MITISDSADARNKTSELKQALSTIRYNRDLHRMLGNIEKMIDKLSSLEVEARRTKRPSILDTKKREIEGAIDHLEKLIMIMRLID